MPTNTKSLAVNVPYNPQQKRFESYDMIERVKACNRWVVLKGVSNLWTASLAARQLSIILNNEQFGKAVDIAEAEKNLDLLADAKTTRLQKADIDSLTFVSKGKIVKQVDKDGKTVPFTGVVYHAENFEPVKRAIVMQEEIEAKAEAKARASLLKTAIEGSKTKAQFDSMAKLLRIPADEVKAALDLNPPKWAK